MQGPKRTALLLFVDATSEPSKKVLEFVEGLPEADKSKVHTSVRGNTRSYLEEELSIDLLPCLVVAQILEDISEYVANEMDPPTFNFKNVEEPVESIERCIGTATIIEKLPAYFSSLTNLETITGQPES